MFTKYLKQVGIKQQDITIEIYKTRPKSDSEKHRTVGGEESEQGIIRSRNDPKFSHNLYKLGISNSSKNQTKTPNGSCPNKTNNRKQKLKTDLKTATTLN